MKSIAFASILALFLLGFAAPQTATASAASGTYQFLFKDKYTKYVEFDAQTLADGSTAGSMFFSDEAPLVYQDVDGSGQETGRFPGFYVKADLDGLVVDQNQAVMSGTVRDSSIRDLIGKRVLLTVEDNGDNTKEPDRLTWGVYKPVVRDWTPSDAEWKEDPGVGLRWWATDAERKDDRGYAMPRSEAFDCQTYPIASYAFADIMSGAGDIIVRL